MLGVMLDCSRNAVMKVDAVKNYIDLLSKIGYDTLMLYTEDTFEVNNEPYFGYMRGRYTKDELKELDFYCKGKGIELIPCIQTLAHLNAIFQPTHKYDDLRDCDDILLIDSDRTYELIDNMLASLAECYTSKNIHIGMDEAGKVGLGKYLRTKGVTNRFDLINRHLHKVCEIACKYGFNPMLWSDMFCSLAAGDTDNIDKVLEKAALPENVSLVYWDYYSDNYDNYMRKIALNKAFKRPVVFAGGAWTWKGFAPDNIRSINNTKAAVKACKDGGVDNIFLTMWGDDGAECSRLSVLPTLVYTAEAIKGNFDLEDIKGKFKELIGIDWDLFLLLDSLEGVGGEHAYNPSKYLLYNDLFTGLNDYRVTKEDSVYYGKLAEKIEAVNVAAPYKAIFKTAKALARALEIKSTLGIKTREAYRAKNLSELKKLAENDYILAIEGIRNFRNSLWEQWSAENKPFGFDIQDIRLGGIIMRLEASSERLIKFAQGETESIPELEIELLEGTGKVQWANYATPNVISHVLFP